MSAIRPQGLSKPKKEYSAILCKLAEIFIFSTMYLYIPLSKKEKELFSQAA